jgi:N-acetylneuraminic acid mutarotase
VKIKQQNKKILLVSIAITLSFSILFFYSLFAIISDNRPYMTLSFDISSSDLFARAMPNMTMNGIGPCGVDPRNLSCIPAPCEQIPPPQWCSDNTDLHNNTNNSNFTSFYTKGPDMPTPRSELAAANIGTRIYVVGGAPGVLDIVEIYDAASATWISSKKDGPSSVAPLPVGVDDAAAASYDGKLYVVGGFVEGQVSSGDLFIYDPIKNAWSHGADMPTPRGGLTANFINGILYAVGGTNENATALDIVEAYNPSNDMWTTNLDPVPTARQELSSAVVDGQLYVIGGRISDPSTNLNSMERFDPRFGNWTILDDMPSKRSGLGAAAIGDMIYVFGGESSNYVFNNNEKYDTRTGNWVSQIPLPTPRHGLTTVVIDKNIYLIGGGLEPTRSSPAAALVEIYHTNGSTTTYQSGQEQELILP